ncbi:TldD/PmbA family protein [Pigmentibacter sp. JX0631]|uniref:TldD/PmbA family protein n=1 Tax=Pigmentibacter sp. JX0631 TaxID=2976982 RepID=UPI0024694C05|nr:TldD/PmbA family protein [Pigmentibacter sp. JX0631]WGL58879.1 TldD/PmbA family protein [Pigmentibacter sp. JX0631]
MSLNIEQIKLDIDSIARSLGIKKYDVFGSAKEESSASAKNKKPFGLNSSSKSYLLVRVWNDKQQAGVTSTSNLTYAGLTDALILAHSSAEYGSTENIYDFSENSQNTSKNIQVINDLENKVTMHDLVEKSIEAETKILDHSSIFKSVPYNKVADSYSKRFYFNSLGAIKVADSNVAYCYFYPLAQEPNKIAREAGHVSISKGFQNLNVLDCAEKAIKKTENHLNYTNIKSGKYKTIFSPEAFLDLLYAFSNFMNAQNILDKKSLLTIENLNSQIAASILNLSDSPLHSANPDPCYFDEEGTITNNINIIQEGKLVTFLHSSFTAQKFNTKSTGHCHLGSKLTISPYFLHVSKNNNINSAQYSSLSQENNVIYIENVKALHAGVNALQGSFSLPFDGFLLNNEKKVSIESATVAGDFLSLLNNIIYIDDNETVTHKGISPNIWIKELSITGNS